MNTEWPYTREFYYNRGRKVEGVCRRVTRRQCLR
jgi:hypothetical protein